MQRLEILHRKLKFIRWFFEQTTAPFAEIKLKIAAGEAPYDRSDVCEEASESPFVMGWLDADEATKLQGQLCLNLLQRSLREYLDDTVKLAQGDAPSTKNNWFENYRKWFLGRGVDWGLSGACIPLIEELTLARDRVQHGSRNDSHSLVKRLDHNYHSRFPDARFQNSFEAGVFSKFGPKLHSIEMTQEKFDHAIEEISKFTTFIEEWLPDSMKYWHG